jgi:hypothetical protein
VYVWNHAVCRARGSVRQWNEFIKMQNLNHELNRRITTMEEQLWALRKQQVDSEPRRRRWF